MKFNHAHCHTCGQDFFKEEEVQAFVRVAPVLTPIDLEGRQPWCGVMCLCRYCCIDIRDAVDLWRHDLKAYPTHEEVKKAMYDQNRRHNEQRPTP